MSYTFLTEVIIGLPNRELHIGVVERPFLTNAAAFIGIIIATKWPSTTFPHFGHVLISTWASMFHIIMALGNMGNLITMIMIGVFLFFAVWLPCCLSDIVFPLVFIGIRRNGQEDQVNFRKDED